jgi:hypothetical protein
MTPDMTPDQLLLDETRAGAPYEPDVAEAQHGRELAESVKLAMAARLPRESTALLL